jgi:hypothetical protein
LKESFRPAAKRCLPHLKDAAMPMPISLKWLCALALVLLVIQGCGCDCGNPNSAQQAADCITNLRALGNGLQMYMQDWDEVMPANAATWTDAIFPYVKVDPPFHCCFRPRLRSAPSGWSTIPATSPGTQTILSQAFPSPAATPDSTM